MKINKRQKRTLSPLKKGLSHKTRLKRLLGKSKINTIMMVALAFGLVVTMAELTVPHDFREFAAGRGGSSNPTPTPIPGPLSLQYENYVWSYGYPDNCINEDDTLWWQAAGSLAPGQSFTFTPKYPECEIDDRSASVRLSWSGSQLQLSTTTTGYEQADSSQEGKSIAAPVISSTAALCFFQTHSAHAYYIGTQPNGQPEYADPAYTITIKNIGTSTASNIVANGQDAMDWNEYVSNPYDKVAHNTFSRCINADADHDLWNDGTEYYMYWIMGAGAQSWNGSNYLKALNGPSVDSQGITQIGTYPADFDNDNVVDQDDVASVSAQLGQGDGVSLDQICPPGSCSHDYSHEAFQWRRFDLNGDGYVNQTDLNIVNMLVGHPIPMESDIIPPTVSAKYLIVSGVGNTANPPSGAEGTTAQVGAYAWDNQAITRVDFYINGNFVCTTSTANDTVSYSADTYPTPLFGCSWKIPHKAGQYSLTARAYDNAGNSTLSAPYIITLQ